MKPLAIILAVALVALAAWYFLLRGKRANAAESPSVAAPPPVREVRSVITGLPVTPKTSGIVGAASGFFSRVLSPPVSGSGVTPGLKLEAATLKNLVGLYAPKAPSLVLPPPPAVGGTSGTATTTAKGGNATTDVRALSGLVRR